MKAGVCVMRRIAGNDFELNLDVGNAGRMKCGRDVAPADLDRGPLALAEVT